MGEIKIRKGIFPAKTKLIFSFQNTFINPLFFKQMPFFLARVFQIPREKVVEKSFKWDVTSPKENSFIGRWVCVEEGVIPGVNLIYDVRVKGSAGKSDGRGSIGFAVKSEIETEISYSSFIEKYLKIFYFRAFYLKKMEGAKEIGRIKVSRLENALKEICGGEKK